MARSRLPGRHLQQASNLPSDSTQPLQGPVAISPFCGSKSPQRMVHQGCIYELIPGVIIRRVEICAALTKKEGNSRCNVNLLTNRTVLVNMESPPAPPPPFSQPRNEVTEVWRDREGASERVEIPEYEGNSKSHGSPLHQHRSRHSIRSDIFPGFLGGGL